MRSERIKEIRNYIYENKTITLESISNRFDISMSTLRRDLNEIIKNSNIRKTYGGVTVHAKKEASPFEERYISGRSAKISIAIAAAELIEDGDIVFIDAGTTTAHVIDHLTDKKNIIILTNNVEIITRAIQYENIEVIALSGSLNRKTMSFVGSSTTQMLQSFNINKALIATTGFSVSRGLTCASSLEADLKRMAIQQSRIVYLLADSSKCGPVSLITYCSLSKVNILITEETPPIEVVNYIKDHDNTIHLAKRASSQSIFHAG